MTNDFIFQHWFFSTAMHRIDSWKMDDVGIISEHLKTCPYNVKNDHKNAMRRTKNWDNIIAQIPKFSIMQGLKKTTV